MHGLLARRAAEHAFERAGLVELAKKLDGLVDGPAHARLTVIGGGEQDQPVSALVATALLVRER